MVDLSCFTQVAHRRTQGGCYIKRMDGKAKLVLDKAATKEAIDYFGSDVSVYLDYTTGRVALGRGNDRRLTASSNQPLVSLGSDEGFVSQWGKFTRIYVKPTWESDERHNKILLFTPTGRVDKEADMTIRKVR